MFLYFSQQISQFISIYELDFSILPIVSFKVVCLNLHWKKMIKHLQVFYIQKQQVNFKQLH